MRTEDLIERLVHDTGRVRPLRSPGLRTAIWLLLAAAFTAAVVILMTPRPDLAEQLRDARFVVEQLAAFATAVVAAYAALVLSIPGADSRLALAPLAPAALWLGSQGVGCVSSLVGAAGGTFGGEPECLIYIALTGSLPAILLVAMLRRGLPVRPRLTLALAVLAAAALGNVGLRFFHMQDAALMVLLWQTGSVALLSLAGWALGRTLLQKSLAP